MRHEQVSDNLSAYIEGTLDTAMSGAIEHHVRGCADCYRDLAVMRDLFAALDSPALDVEPPGRFHDDVMRRVRLSQRSAPAGGFLSRFGWGWSAVAGTAAAAALFTMVTLSGPHDSGGVSAGVHVPRWAERAPTVRALSEPDLVAGSDGPAKVGQEYHLNLDFVARRAGHWSLSVQTSNGIEVLNTGGRDSSGVYQIWDGTLENGAKTGLTLMLQPNRGGAVQEAVVRFHNLTEGTTVERWVFIPVETGGAPGQAMDWQSQPGQTLRGAFEELARVYGTAVAAPGDILDDPARLQAANVNAGDAVSALSRAQSLRATRDNETYNFYR